MPHRPRRVPPRALLSVALLLIVACTAPPPREAQRPPQRSAPPPARVPANGGIRCLDARTLDTERLTNTERTRRGLRALEPDARLQEAAQRHASDMARGDFMAHEGSDGALAPERATRVGYRWTTVAENVAAGYPDPAAVVAGWMASPGHRANILDPEVRHVGVGYAYRTDTRLHHYWVMVFGATDGARAEPATCT